MATITNLGIGSAGLGDLYNQLDTAERTKLKTITTQQTTYNAQLSAYGKLQSAMTNLQTATAALAKPATELHVCQQYEYRVHGDNFD